MMHGPNEQLGRSDICDAVVHHAEAAALLPTLRIAGFVAVLGNMVSPRTVLYVQHRLAGERVDAEGGEPRSIES